jgi:hypothetical protein
MNKLAETWGQLVEIRLDEIRRMDYRTAKTVLLDLVDIAPEVYGVSASQARIKISWWLHEFFLQDWLKDPDFVQDIARFNRISELETQPVNWLWGSRIPLRRVTVLDGDPGLGKSTLTLDIAARVSTGFPFPDMWQCEPADVVILSAEDGLCDTVKPRLEAAGADLSRVWAVDLIQRRSGLKTPPDIYHDLDAIARGMEPQTRLLIVDPLMAYLPDGANYNSDKEMRRCLQPLAEFSAGTGVASLLVRHLRKGAQSESALYAGGGSIGITGFARSVLMVGKHPEGGDRRVLAPVKTNLCRMPPSLGFALEDDQYGRPTIAWDVSPTNVTADELIAARKPKKPSYPVH